MQVAGGSMGMGRLAQGIMSGSDLGLRSVCLGYFLAILKEDDSDSVQIAFSPEPAKPAKASTTNQNGRNLEYKILKQIEFYFSDANILKDQFLLKAVKSSKEGWVKLSTIAGFKRVQVLTKDEELIRDVLKKSEQLEISDDGAHVRRRNPLPEWDRTVYARSVLITHFKQDDIVRISQIVKFFKSKGLCVELVRIIDANKPIPSDLIKTATHLGYLGKEKCAVVEFDNKESALKALPLTKSLWPTTFATLCQLKVKPKKENGTAVATDVIQRPQISLKSKYSNVRVLLLRDPVAPTTEDCVGFDPNWREALRLERIGVLDTEQMPTLPSNRADKDDEKEYFFTPITPSPDAPVFTPSVIPPAMPLPCLVDAQSASNLMFLDDAIAFMSPQLPKTPGL
ncbi:hypothetical protein Aperf_G00000013864 [Anoplocephala perfoliata]